MAKTEHAQYQYARDLQGLPLLKASFRNQRFSRHVHEGYCIGLIENGAQKFFRSGANHIASENCVILVNPDQIHDGQTATEKGWKYRAIYPTPQLVDSVVKQISPNSKGTLSFSQPVVTDPCIAVILRNLYETLEFSDNTLERETIFYHALANLLKRHGELKIPHLKYSQQCHHVEVIKDYINTYSEKNISTYELSRLVDLNPFYLTRLFQKQIGMPPHAYQIQLRLRRAKQKLSNGSSLLHTALECGFSDQSHLTRHFKKWLGVTPGQFRAQTHGVSCECF